MHRYTALCLAHCSRAPSIGSYERPRTRPHRRNLLRPALPEPHPCGLLHLPRFIAECRKHLRGELPKSYQKNFCRGFDRFLSMHLGIDPKDVLQAVEQAGDDEIALDQLLGELFPDDESRRLEPRSHQKGQPEAGREFLAESLTNMGTPEMIGQIDSVMQMIDFDEGRIPGFSDAQRRVGSGSELVAQHRTDAVFLTKARRHKGMEPPIALRQTMALRHP